MAADAAGRLGPAAELIVDLVVDDTYFADPLAIPGVAASSQPYDAPNGALCANFNTVNYATEAGRRISAEPQTPPGRLCPAPHRFQRAAPGPHHP